MKAKPLRTDVDVLLIGAGIMSATLATFLKELQPDATIHVVEALTDCALESSGAWNSAGTGHAANCELNYTPQLPDGRADISKALQVNSEFDISRQLWAYLITRGAIKDPRSFINPVPHMSFVRGDEDIEFLRKRYAAMSQHHCYRGMVYTDNPNTIAEWVPLVMEGRVPDEPIAATRIDTGTDVDYGSLTHHLMNHLRRLPRFHVHYDCRVIALSREPDSRWHIEVESTQDASRHSYIAKFVFVGAGGGALPLLEQSGIPEGQGYAGFPVSGIWLRCDNPEITRQHHAKVYGKAPGGSPPMSVPHLDTRIIDG